MWNVLILRACENIDVNASFPKVARQFTHINIHPSGVFTPQGSQRTGMVRQHGYTQFSPSPISHHSSFSSHNTKLSSPKPLKPKYISLHFLSIPCIMSRAV